jgi:hypothetical protein
MRTPHRARRAVTTALLFAATASVALNVDAQDVTSPEPRVGPGPEGRAETAPASVAPEVVTPPVTLVAYGEVYYQLNLRDPSNGITDFRGFDNRHNTFTVSNVALGGTLDTHDVVAALVAQMGATPDTYYLAEPARPGGAGASGSDAPTWKYLQQANVGYRFHVPRDLTVQAGLFLSPIGPEGIAVKDNWTWSRSNLFFGLPFYHTGARVTYSLTDRWAVTAAVYNGWNSLVDNNDEKSVSAQLTYTEPDAVALSVLYFGGVERPDGAPEGRAWRHDIDAHVTVTVTDWLSLQAHANVGFEPNEFGTSSWEAGAMAARFHVAKPLYVAGRADVFFEQAASDATGTAARILWPADWVTSQTATLELRAGDHLSTRLEYRHDLAASDMFFGGEVDGDGVATPFVADRETQDTITVGMTAWF